MSPKKRTAAKKNAAPPVEKPQQRQPSPQHEIEEKTVEQEEQQQQQQDIHYYDEMHEVLLRTLQRGHHTLALSLLSSSQLHGSSLFWATCTYHTGISAAVVRRAMAISGQTKMDVSTFPLVLPLIEADRETFVFPDEEDTGDRARGSSSSTSGGDGDSSGSALKKRKGDPSTIAGGAVTSPSPSTTTPTTRAIKGDKVYEVSSTFSVICSNTGSSSSGGGVSSSNTAERKGEAPLELTPSELYTLLHRCLPEIGKNASNSMHDANGCTSLASAADAGELIVREALYKLERYTGTRLTEAHGQHSDTSEDGVIDLEVLSAALQFFCQYAKYTNPLVFPPSGLQDLLPQQQQQQQEQGEESLQQHGQRSGSEAASSQMGGSSDSTSLIPTPPPVMSHSRTPFEYLIGMPLTFTQPCGSPHSDERLRSATTAAAPTSSSSVNNRATPARRSAENSSDSASSAAAAASPPPPHDLNATVNSKSGGKEEAEGEKEGDAVALLKNLVALPHSTRVVSTFDAVDVIGDTHDGDNGDDHEGVGEEEKRGTMGSEIERTGDYSTPRAVYKLPPLAEPLPTPPPAMSRTDSTEKGKPSKSGGATKKKKGDKHGDASSHMEPIAAAAASVYGRAKTSATGRDVQAAASSEADRVAEAIRAFDAFHNGSEAEADGGFAEDSGGPHIGGGGANEFGATGRVPRRRTRFTEEEDKAILKGITIFGNRASRFRSIFQAFRSVWQPGRTPTGLYDHWRDALRRKAVLANEGEDYMARESTGDDREDEDKMTVADVLH